MALLLRLLRALPFLLLSPLMLVTSALALLATDAAWMLFGPRRKRQDRVPDSSSASVVIPNWNGRDLLEKYLPSVEAALAGHQANEIVVVDNGSTDGSADFVRSRFPGVRLLALPANLGFGGGSNAGFRAARNDIVVLLNSDMRVAPDFLAPLLCGFQDPQVFAVSCQIFFSDPERLREETGLTQGWWQDGGLRVRHRIDDTIQDLYPCFYGGGGSCAFDRAKFLELGGFDELFTPFYLEDTSLGYQAWKRGWKVLYQPKSVVYHEHRGTIGKRFGEDQIQAVLKKNFILFCWKNVHEWRRLASHFAFTYAGALLSVLFGDELGRANFRGIWRACLQLPGALRSRWRARALAEVSDSEAFLRPLGGYFRDRFAALDANPPRLGVLFVSPYPICPPVHGGGVFMFQTLRELAKLCDVHVIALLDHWDQVPANEELRDFCASAEFIVRMQGKVRTMGSIEPFAVAEFRNEDLQWLIHRQMYLKAADVLQLEYTALGQYNCRFHRLASVLFEHDVYFQSIARGLGHMRGALAKVQARFEYLRALRYELSMLPACDAIQVCTRENKDYLASFGPALRPKLQEGLRAGIDTSGYRFCQDGREPFTMLFLGSFRHVPNQTALDWFIHNVLALILARCPQAKLIVVGSDPPPAHAYGDLAGAVDLRGFVENVQPLLETCAVFVCPILSGSGVRVKLLEAFSSGIPVVSTRIGAEGLAQRDGEVCRLADDPAEFARAVTDVFDNLEAATAMARRARELVERDWDMAAITAKLEQSYRQILVGKAEIRLASVAQV